MKTKTIKAIALAVVTALTIISNSFADTDRKTPSSDTVKTIQIGPKGTITVVYKKKTPNIASSHPASPRKMLSQANSYESLKN